MNNTENSDLADSRNVSSTIRDVARCLFAAYLFTSAAFVHAEDDVVLPKVDGRWWQVAGNPNLGNLTTEKQQPVDFGVWQAADGTWQLWSCIRHTREPGKTRLFHAWQGDTLTATDWKPKGIAMQADPTVGETAGGMQAPYVIRHDGRYLMFYGDWQNICIATSDDGKQFKRNIVRGIAGVFGDAPRANTRDAMVLKVGDLWHCYYTAHPDAVGGVYCRTSPDLENWSDRQLVRRGGTAGTKYWSSECPHVVPHDGHYYLLTTQRYLGKPQTSIYRSKEPLDFGVDDDRYLVGTMPVAAPEIIVHEGEYYIAALNPMLDGIRIAKLKWTAK